MSGSPLRALIGRWRDDPGGTYRSWFLWEERIKNFRSIRSGITQVVAEIERGAFGSAYKGSSLETVVGSIAEQRQIFKGADHAFLWKPKLRIPDVYSTCIYSGICRLLDLALGAGSEATRALFLVAPDEREEEVRTQRPHAHVTGCAGPGWPGVANTAGSILNCSTQSGEQK